MPGNRDEERNYYWSLRDIPKFEGKGEQPFSHLIDKWGFWYLIGWFVGGTGCTLQTLYTWLVRGFGIGMVGILIYRVLHLSLGCDSWYACYVINLVKSYKVHVLTIHHLLYV